VTRVTRTFRFFHDGHFDSDLLSPGTLFLHFVVGTTVVVPTLEQYRLVLPSFINTRRDTIGLSVDRKRLYIAQTQ
jgi:hypothetical protein